MKKIVLLGLFVGLNYISNAQTNAILALENNELKVAKESIDKYFVKNAAKLDKEPKAWYYKGKIYQMLTGSDKPELLSLVGDSGLAVAVKSYNKAIDLDLSKSGDWKKLAKEQLEGLWAVAYNEAVKKYQEDKLTESLANCSLAQSIKPNDTTAYTLGANLALLGKNYGYAKKCYEKLFEIGYKRYEFYKNYYYITLEEEQKKEEAYAFLDIARKEFPQDAFFMAQQVNAYIELGKKDEAIAKLKEAISTDPKNSNTYYYNLGIISKQTNDNIAAREYFTKSLEIDPQNEGSNFMMGFMFVEEGDIVNKKVNNMNIKEYNTSGKKEEAKRDELYKKSLPFFEKSYAVSKDPKVKDQLITLYKRLKMEDKIKNLN